MALPRVGRDEENAAFGDEDSPTSKKARLDVRFPLSWFELAAAIVVFLTFVVGILFIFSTMPREEYEKILRLPRTLSDLRLLNATVGKSLRKRRKMATFYPSFTNQRDVMENLYLRDPTGHPMYSESALEQAEGLPLAVEEFSSFQDMGDRAVALVRPLCLPEVPSFHL